MLCISIAEKEKNKILPLLQKAEMAEIRIEQVGLSFDEISEIFASHNNLIATCRPDTGLSDNERKKLLTTAIDAGAAWVDIEVESDKRYADFLVSYAKSKNCKVIISYHNYKQTPDSSELKKIIDVCVNMKAELVKIATFVNIQKDVATLLGLYADNTNILALGMGDLGKITRIAAVKLGAPFTFVSIDDNSKTAQGQISESKMKKILEII